MVGDRGWTVAACSNNMRFYALRAIKIVDRVLALAYNRPLLSVCYYSR